MKRTIEFNFGVLSSHVATAYYLTERERLAVINAYRAGVEMTNDPDLIFKDYLYGKYGEIAGLVFEDGNLEEDLDMGYDISAESARS
jgi:hypothetical protein